MHERNHSSNIREFLSCYEKSVPAAMNHHLNFENCEEIILRLVVKEYAAKHRLSKRESEILETLVDGATNTGELSTNLGISPNTTNNHLKRMMDKTGNSSKLDLITQFYKYMMSRLAYAFLYSKKPKVLLIDDEVDFGEMLAEELTYRGMHAYFESNPEKATQRVAEIYPDFVLLDIYMPRVDGLVLLRQIREQLPHEPSIIIISGRAPDEATLLNDGAAAVFSKPLNADELFNIMVDLYSDPPIKGLRMTRVRTDFKTTIKPSELEVKVQNIGYGGAFIKIPTTRSEIWDQLGIGKRLVLPLHLEGIQLDVGCVVTWQRQAKSSNGSPGVGVKFVGATPDQMKAIRAYVRRQRVKGFAPVS